MKTGPKVAIGASLLVAVAIGGEMLYLKHRDAEDKVAPKKAEYKSDPDDLVFLKNQHPMSLKDEKDLKGKTLWMSAGGQMNYFPYAGGKVDYAHTAGVLLGAEKIVVKDAIEAVAPKTAVASFRIPAGDKQVLLVFTRPEDAAGKEYVVPVGTKLAGDYTFSTDQMFFYDDPHQLYAAWGTDVWKAIDEHRAIVGMSEREVQMALGQVSNPHGDTMGNRTVEFEAQGHPKVVRFENNKATSITDEAQYGG